MKTKNNKKTVLITGVLGGLGKVMSFEFLKNGYHILGLDLNLDQLKNYEAECLSQFGEGSFKLFASDLSKRENVKKIMSEIEVECGVPDIVINNAGLAAIKGFLDESEAEFDKIMSVNFHAVVDICRFWLEKMHSQKKGKIVNIASVAGHVAPAGLESYASSKFAVVGFTQSLQLELKAKKSKVKVVLVSPGFVNTQIMQIGKENGPPKEMAYFTSKPEDCGKKIVEGILQDESMIFPTFNGKAMITLSKWAPSLLEKINISLSKKILK